MSIVNISYNSYNLQTSADSANTILSRDILFKHLPIKEIFLQQDSIRNGFSISDVRYSQKIITVRGWLISDTQAHLRTLRDAFMTALSSDKEDLDIDYGSGTIRFEASVQNVTCDEEFWQITQIPFEISFLAQPFGTATSTTTIDLNSGGNITTTPFSEGITISGSYNPKPVITITVVAETDMTAIKFENTTTQDWIQVARSFADAEVLTIDCDAETVQVGSTNVDFTGVLPSFNPSSNTIKITSTDSGVFQITVSIVYYQTFL